MSVLVFESAVVFLVRGVGGGARNGLARAWALWNLVCAKLLAIRRLTHLIFTFFNRCYFV